MSAATAEGPSLLWRLRFVRHVRRLRPDTDLSFAFDTAIYVFRAGWDATPREAAETWHALANTDLQASNAVFYTLDGKRSMNPALDPRVDA